MAKFVSPLGRLLRSAISHSSFSKSFSTTAKVASYKAAVCTELGKPLVIKDVDDKPLGQNEVDYYMLNHDYKRYPPYLFFYCKTILFSHLKKENTNP